MGAMKRFLEDNIDKMTDYQLAVCGYNSEEIAVLRSSFGELKENPGMKIGDKVYSTRVRPKEIAVIEKSDVKISEKETKKGTKKEIRTAYKAKYPDGAWLLFYGFDIGRSVFKADDDGQLDLSMFMNIPEV